MQKYGDRILAIELDVNDRDADFVAVAQAHEHFAGLDIVVNNAGFGQFGMVEELSESQLRDQIETNLFGALWITQAALPFLRKQGSGHIIQVSSIGGISAFPGIGAYHASKWALEGISQSLAAGGQADIGIHVTLIEPGGFSTDWGGSSAKHADQLDAYDGVREAGEKRRSGNDPGDPEASAEALLKIVDADEPPLRAFFGKAPLSIAEQDYEGRLASWREWQPVAELAHG